MRKIGKYEFDEEFWEVSPSGGHVSLKASLIFAVDDELESRLVEQLFRIEKAMKPFLSFDTVSANVGVDALGMSGAAEEVDSGFLNPPEPKKKPGRPKKK